MKLTRRTFLQLAGATGATVTLANKAMAFRLLKPAVEVGNPLDAYPDRNWESVY
ncbi:MAG: twin-arginine translocation signal domain-containing protein, partial [wastewater metagenome]|nr:twin-arginine translocation signal domain-containing protein [Candidatus Loosdrechtia aerotolerans]